MNESSASAVNFRTDVERKIHQNAQKKDDYELKVVNEWILLLTTNNGYVSERVSDEMSQNQNYAILFTLRKRDNFLDTIDWLNTTFSRHFDALKGCTIADTIKSQLPPLVDTQFSVRGFFTYLTKDPYCIVDNRDYRSGKVNMAHKLVTYYMIVVEWTKTQPTMDTMGEEENYTKRKCGCIVQ
jgi:hypothetical protein